MLFARRSLLTLHLFDNPSTAKNVASVRRFVLHAFVHFLDFEDLLAVGKSNMYTIADGVWAFAFKSENVGEETHSVRTSVMAVTARPDQNICLRSTLYAARRSLLSTRPARDERLIENIQQSTICRSSEVVSHARKRSSILPAGTGESDKMTLASDGFITCCDCSDHLLPVQWHSRARLRLRRRARRHHLQARKRHLSVPRAANTSHQRQLLPVSFAPRWSRQQQKMDYHSIFLSASSGKKVDSTRWRSAPRALKVLRNSCRELPTGEDSVIHLM